MRIEKIILKNYRQFKEIEILLNKRSDNDLHIVIGRNGTGKTNILNAINWCLYEDEPHLSKNSQQLPLLNLKSLEEADNGESLEVMAEVWTKTEDNKYIIFTRKAAHKVHKDGKQPRCRIWWSEFEIRCSDEKGNTKILKGEEANSYVERFVPKRIREFFFFDGERLDHYFKEVTGQNIRHAIFEISQIDLLDRVEDRLDKVLNDFRKEAGKCSPEIEEARKRLEKEEFGLSNVKQQLEECNKQIAIAKEEIRECEKKLKGSPDVEALEKEREKLKINSKQKEERRGEKAKEKQDLLFDYGKIIRFWPAIKKSLQIIQEKRKNREIPPRVDPGLLEDILKNKVCSICGRHLDSHIEKRVDDLLKEIKLSSDIIQQLLNMENPLRLFGEKVKHFEEEIRKITQDIDGYDSDLAKIEQKTNEIDREISGYNAEKIKGWHGQRTMFEKTHDENLQILGVLKAKKDGYIKEIDGLKRRLNEELKKEEKANKLKRQMDFCDKVSEVVRKTKQIIMMETRGKIESETRRLFFELLWKKETFKEVKIEDDYSINLVHSMGYECLGSVSAAERELLALSFTLALHKISGFDSPILIDTPVARVSDEHRENFGRIFSEVSKDKQTILLLTPAEYSEDISSLLDNKSSNKYTLRLSSDENETNMEVLKNAQNP